MRSTALGEDTWTESHIGLYLVGLDLAEGTYQIGEDSMLKLILFPSVILVIRTWACWGRNKWVGIGLALWITVCQIPSAIFMYKFLGSLRCELLVRPEPIARLTAE